MKENFDKIEEEISRSTNKQEREDLKSSLFDLRAQFARHAFEDEIMEAKGKALRRKLLPVKFLCVIAVFCNAWWHVSLFLDGGHYTKRGQLITFANEPISYTVNAAGWTILGGIAMFIIYWIIKLFLIDRQDCS